MSIFFQISETDFLEAAKFYGYGNKEYALRIVSFKPDGKQTFVYLAPVSLNELSILTSILQLRLIPTLKTYTDLRPYYLGTVVYY